MVLRIIKGDTVGLSLTITDQNNNAINLSGATVFFTVKQRPADDEEDAIISKDVTDHTNASLGLSTITLLPEDTDIEPGAYYYDIQVKNALGVIQSIESDKFIVRQDVTARTT